MPALWFEPSARVRGAAERRQAQLLSILQFTHIWIFASTGLVMRFAEVGALHVQGAATMGCASLGAAASYALSRTRHFRFAAWTYVLINFAAGPIITWFCWPDRGGAAIKIAYVLIPVLLASILSSARATLLCAAAGLASELFALLSNGAPVSHDELKPAIVFFLTSVALLLVLGYYRDGVEADRSTELRARNAELEALRGSLEARVVARTAELSSRNAQMRLVFDNVAQALFTLDVSGVISSEHSAVLSKWFGPLRDAQTFYEYFARCSAAFAANAECSWQQLVDDDLPSEVALAQMPEFLAYGGRHFRFSFELIDGLNPVRCLVVISDVTAEFEREALQRERIETLAVFERVLADRPGFLAFMDEASELVKKSVSPNVERSEFARAIHTLKGNCSFFGIATVTALCHDIESILNQDEQPIAPARLAPLEQRWAQITATVDRLLGARRHVIELSTEQYAAIEQVVRQGRPHFEVLNMLQDLKLEPVEQRLQQFAEQARQIALRLDKQASVEVAHDGLRLERRRWAPLWAAIVHAVRNAVDHGFEAPAQRLALGKPAANALALRALRDASSFRIELEDDGRGIDWEVVRARCTEKGMPAGTQDELVLALFSGGVSTALEVSDISGRGVGMSALRSAVLQLGGQLEIESELGLGTRLRMRFPASEL